MVCFLLLDVVAVVVFIMSLAVVYCRAQIGILAPEVTVEAHVSPGLPKFTIVGLPEAVVKESKDRVRSALMTSRFDFPAARITVNLGPAELPKEGGRFDLAIALSILGASGQIPTDQLLEYDFIGELALSGELRSIKGALALGLASRRGNRALILPANNIAEASLCAGLRLYSAAHLLEVCAHLCGINKLPTVLCHAPLKKDVCHDDLADIRGQVHAKRALEIAAAGGHSLLFIGPPGTGKTMLASRLPSILPPLSEEEAIEVAAVTSSSHHGFNPALWGIRPVRTPHHTSSAVALVGGGALARPGEISLAHNGVLFLDELPEFNRHVLEVLREPLESGKITISRAARQSEYPAKFQLICAMNPCPCGHTGNPHVACRCTPEAIKKYQNRLSGPLLDRIDMHVEVPALPSDALMISSTDNNESSATVRQRVIMARARQSERGYLNNASLSVRQLHEYCVLNEKVQAHLTRLTQKLTLSARSSHRVLKVARTIADLAMRDDIMIEDINEAMGFRYFDRVSRLL